MKVRDKQRPRGLFWPFSNSELCRVDVGRPGFANGFCGGRELPFLGFDLAGLSGGGIVAKSVAVLEAEIAEGTTFDRRGMVSGVVELVLCRRAVETELGLSAALCH